MGGYAGYSKSNNALAAESEGRFPLSAATKIVAKATGLRQSDAKALLEKLHGGEWHHSSKMYNRVKYYDTAEAIEHHRLTQIAAALSGDWRARMDEIRRQKFSTFAARESAIDAADTALAAELGIDVTTLVDCFYL